MEGSAKMGEDSSWTFYIQGFICDNDDDDDDDKITSEFESPSLVSDASSSAVAKKLANKYNWTEDGVGFSKHKIISKQNSFKKQKTKVTPTMEYELEDTASSPVNSPKVSYMNELMNQKEKGKRNSFGKGGVFGVERDSDYTDLNKRSV